MEAEQLFSRAQVARDNGQTSEAIDFYSQAREKFQEAKMWQEASECLHQGGNCYRMGINGLPKTETFNLAEQSLMRALEEFQNQNIPLLIGATQRDLGLTQLQMGQLERAETSIKDSIKTLEGTEALGHLGMSKIALGRVYSAQESYDQALQMIKEGITDTKKSEDFFFTSTGYWDLAQLNKKAGLRDEAYYAAHQALDIIWAKFPLDQFRTRRIEINGFLDDLEAGSH